MDFADNIGIVVTARTEDELRQNISVAVESVIVWLTDNELKIAPEKTEAVILAGRRTLLTMDIQVQNCKIRTSESIKYLGVYFDKAPSDETTFKQRRKRREQSRGIFPG